MVTYVSCAIVGVQWTIYIKDNGGGFPEHILNKIREQKIRIDDDFRDNLNGISIETEDQAFLNVYIRLEAMYGEKASMSISNADTGGAVIRIRGGNIN